MNNRERYNIGVWVENYNILVDYKKAHGNINIDQNYAVNGYNVGLWLKRQRSDYRNGKFDSTDIKFKLLSKLDKNWCKPKADILTWDDHYKLLQKYHKEHGDLNVPWNYEVDGVKLGSWLTIMRGASRTEGSHAITQAQIILLNRLDPNWATLRNKPVDLKVYFDILEDYKKEHGNINIPFNSIIDGVRIGRWLKEQCYDYKNASIHPKKVAIFVGLNKLENDWGKSATKRLNKNITNMEIYNKDLISRTNNVLRDLTWENINEINSKEDQKLIEKEMIKRIWR